MCFLFFNSLFFLFHCFFMVCILLACFIALATLPPVTSRIVPKRFKKISPKSIPNSQKQKQLPNTQWVKYVHCPALLTLEVGRARRNQRTLYEKTLFQKRLQYCGQYSRSSCEEFFPKQLLSASLFTSST